MKKFNVLIGFIIVLMVMMTAMCTVSFAKSANDAFLIHEYNFDSDSESNVVDSIINGAINGTANGTTFITGYNGGGNARHFDGSSYITFSDKVFPVGKKSIAFRIRKASSSEISSGQVEYFFGNNMNSQTDYGTCGYFNSDGTVTIVCSNAGQEFVVRTSKNICDNKWHYIVYSWDGTTNTDSVKLYVDNFIVPNCKTTATFTEQQEGSYNLNIGSLAQGYAEYKFIGDIDNFQVYNRDYINSTPTNLTATAGDAKIVLSWTLPLDAVSHNIFRTETSGTGFAKIGSTSSGISTYTDTPLKNGTTYYYYIAAVNASGDTTSSTIVSATPQPSKQQLKLVLEVNENKQLSISEELYDNSEMEWTSSDATIATVDENGKVKALKAGDAVITCTSEDKSYTESINVLVVDLEYQLAVDLTVGDNCRLTVDDLANATNVTWSSYDSTIAAVTSKGKVTAINEGLTYLVASDKDSKEIGTIYIRVRE